MNRRIVAGVLAVLLAGLGGVLVIGYATGADQRAMAGMDPVAVLVVAQTVPEGTAAEELGDLVSTEELPSTAVAPGALSSVAEVAGLVTTTELLPGEQLFAGRFVDPQALADAARVEVPEGMHQLSVLLDPQRVLGGHLTPGATVGVFISVTDPAETHLVQHKVLVTDVQGGIVPASQDEPDPDAATAAPVGEGSVMVTLAVEGPDAEQIVFGAEHGSIWLSLEDTEADDSETRIVDRESVYE